MSKVKHIYVTGDSFAFGQELVDPTAPSADFTEFTPHMRKHSYTGIITDSWGVPEYTNNAFPGGSNDRILRVTVSDVSRLLTAHAPSELFVFISLTHPSRRELYYPDWNSWYPLMPSYAPKTTDRDHYKLWQIYTTHFNSPYEQATRFITQLVSLQSFLQIKNIDYLITMSMPNHDDELDRLIAQHRKECVIDQRHTLMGVSFAQHTADNGKSLGSQMHPLEDGHRAWANYLMEYMAANNIGEPTC